MMKRISAGIILVLLLTCILALAFDIKPVRASGTIYVKADGSIDPPDASISTFDNVTYTLTGNITSDGHGIVVERDNIVVEGAGYTVQGSVTGNGNGIFLNERINVTIKNMKIKAFELGINLYHSSNNTISTNDITNNKHTGIYFQNSNNNTISGNNATDNWFDILLFESSNNVLRYNMMANNTYNFEDFGSWSVTDFMNDVDASNMVEGKPIYYWVNRQDMTVPLDAGYVVLANCTGITALSLNLAKNGEGILLAFTTNSNNQKQHRKQRPWNQSLLFFKQYDI